MNISIFILIIGYVDFGNPVDVRELLYHPHMPGGLSPTGRNFVQWFTVSGHLVLLGILGKNGTPDRVYDFTAADRFN